MLIGIVIRMEFLHSKGIIHRDLKPENILLDENLYPKICNFGISIISDDELLKNQKSREGTPIYLAPEIIFYEAPYSFCVDVYAFALIAYELNRFQTLNTVQNTTFGKQLKKEFVLIYQSYQIRKFVY